MLGDPLKLKQITLTLLLMTLAIGCEDNVIEDSSIVSTPDTPTTVTIDPALACKDTSFTGIESFSEVKDISLKIHWSSSSSVLGYTVFKKIEGGSLQLVESISPGISEYAVTGLSASSNYEFLIKSIGSDALHDCNTSIKAVSTIDRETFKSCNDIAVFYGSGVASGEYEIDVDMEGPKNPLTVYCEMDRNGGGWTRVLVHKVAAGVFANDTEALELNADNTDADLYSILSYLGDLKRDDKYEFWLNYPELDSVDAGNHWTQSSNPATDLIADYIAISVDHISNGWGGLEKSGGPTFINGSVGFGNWYYAIGSKTNWGGAGKIPGPSAAVSEVYLYIR